jgi:uncharacterized MAPEG superfamily protein
MSYDCPYSIADREDQVDDYQEWKDFRVSAKGILEGRLTTALHELKEAISAFNAAAMDETVDVTKGVEKAILHLNEVAAGLSQFRTNY